MAAENNDPVDPANAVTRLSDHPRWTESRRDLKHGGGDGTSGGMEARVKSLEDKFEKIDTKLTGIATDLAYLKGKSEGAPSAKDFGELKGRVEALPTTSKLATVIGIVGAIVAIVTKWADIKTALGW
ncbi:hypothetical protein LB553_05545 [Mesorhizobium sp. CA8]|uniref:hypothetical protein n=1 Tax=Mesorhizobium sp. CA8 TaxID=2876637 RepID=UPI001CCE7AC5|nr:hypothetical protein [Mesorhizobium sp. CA8]MBZ9760339.1 hypothetical protein [Mesorhizobium sp. CA8]